MSPRTKCKQCGKLFYITSWRDWVYQTPNAKGGSRFFCSWGCMRAWEKAHPRKWDEWKE